MNDYKFSQDFDDLLLNYPDDVSRVFISIFETVLNVVPEENIYSLLLIGSSSRSELSYSFNDGLDFFSDIEFLIITNSSMSPDNIKVLDDALKSLENSLDIRSPLFYIDYGISTRKKFRLTPPTLWSFEVKSLGLIVYGKDARTDLKSVSMSNLDLGNLNELIIVRLWNMFINTSNNYLKGKSNSYEDFVVKFFYSRNILDILTILLPNKNELIGGYKNRQFFFETNFDSPKWNNYKVGFNNATKLKLSLENNITMKEAQNLFLNGYLNLISEISGLEEISNLEDLENKSSKIFKSKIFKEKLVRTLRRKYIEFTLFVRYYKFSLRSISFFMNDKIRFSLLFSLLNIHKSIISENNKSSYLIKSMKYFNKIQTKDIVTYNQNLSYFENLEVLRNNLIDFMMVWFYSRSVTTKHELLKHITWKDKRRHY